MKTRKELEVARDDTCSLLKSSLKETRSITIRPLLRKALRHSELCLQTWNKLERATDLLHQDVRGLTQRVNSSTYTAINHLTNISEQINSIQDDSLRSMMQESYNTVVTGIKRSRIVQTSASSILQCSEERISTLNLDLFSESLFATLKLNEQEYARKALIQLFDFLIGLIPTWGSVISGISTIRKILTSRKTAARDASEYVANIEEYVSNTWAWCLAAQLVIYAIEGIHSSADPL